MIKALLKILCTCIAVVAIVIGATNALVVLTTEDDIVSVDEASGYQADAIVVLGASVFADGTPSTILQDRLDCGIALYKAGAAPKIIMSGDNSTEHYNECAAMKRYAIAQGVPSEDIFCDHAGFSTYESMYRAKNVFGCSRVVIATQTYHLYRALYSAHALGVDAIGVASDYRSYGKQTWYDVREIPARTKDFFKALFDVPSTYVGDPISLDQSGDVTGWLWENVRPAECASLQLDGFEHVDELLLFVHVELRVDALAVRADGVLRGRDLEIGEGISLRCARNAILARGVCGQLAEDASCRTHGRAAIEHDKLDVLSGRVVSKDSLEAALADEEHEPQKVQRHERGRRQGVDAPNTDLFGEGTCKKPHIM